MTNPEFSELKSVKINPDLLSRGSGERVTLQESVVYDFMPRVLGSRFMGVDVLRQATHYYGGGGSFMMCDQAYNEVAEEELKSGNLTAALEAYKRRLHAAVGFVRAMAAFGDRALLNSEEINQLNLEERFGNLESKLIHTVVSQDIAFDLPSYIKWLSNVRRLESDSRLASRTYKMPGDLQTGTRLRDLYAEMQQYNSAAYISREIGDIEGLAKYEELGKTQPQENPKFRPILWRIQADYDRGRD